MPTFFAKHKIFTVVTAVVIVLAIISFAFRNQDQLRRTSTVSSSSKPTGPLITKTPKEAFITPDVQAGIETFEVLSVEPKPDQGVYGASQTFTITFNEPVKPGKMLIGTNDGYPIQITQGAQPNQIIVGPRTFWEIERDYSVKVAGLTASETGKILKIPYEFIFRIQPVREFGEDY